MMNVSIAGALLSFIILFVIILSVFYLISRMKINNIAYALLGVYSFILVIAAVIYIFIPVEKMSNERELAGEEAREDIVHHVVYQGQAIEDFAEYKVEEWEFHTDINDKIGLNIEGTEHHIPVLIEKDSKMTNINATLYHVEPVVELESVFEMKEKTGIYLDNLNLIISPPSPKLYSYAIMEKEFPFTQFNNSEEEPPFYSLDIYTGEYVFYLKVPDSQEFIFGPDVYYEYVE